MAEKFLKRFERLENIPKNNFSKEGIKLSKRFERLEIGDKKIDIAITDRVGPEEKAPAEIKHTLYCPYCGMENEVDALNCSFCQHNLKSKLVEDYQYKANFLRECSCGAVNRKDRPYCWICGKYLGQEETVKPDSGNVITFNIDGHEYKSTDEFLPFDIKILIERIRKNGYSKTLVDEWLKERDRLKDMAQEKDNETKQKRDDVESRISAVKLQLIVRIAGLVLFSIFLLFQFRACMRFM